MKPFIDCPFCCAVLTRQDTNESSKYICKNLSCLAASATRFKTFVRNDKVTHLHFLLGGFNIDISYLNNTTSISKYQECLSKKYLVPYITMASESEVIINESPEISFDNLDDLLNKIKTWVTFS